MQAACLLWATGQLLACPLPWELPLVWLPWTGPCGGVLLQQAVWALGCSCVAWVSCLAWQLVLLSGAPTVDPWVKIKIRPKPIRFRVSEPKNPWSQTKTQNRNPKPEIRGYPPQTRPTAILTSEDPLTLFARAGGFGFGSRLGRVWFRLKKISQKLFASLTTNLEY